MLAWGDGEGEDIGGTWQSGRGVEGRASSKEVCISDGLMEGGKLKRVTEEKRRKRQRMEEMKKKDMATSSSTLDRDVAWESSTSSSSANEDTKDDFKAPTPAKSLYR